MGMGTKFFLGRGYYQGTKGTKVGVLIRVAAGVACRKVLQYSVAGDQLHGHGA